jgi:hypothetical protein
MSDKASTKLHDVPIGVKATGMRRETDSMGEIEVPADRYWGAQTQRSLVKARLSRLWLCQEGGGIGQRRGRAAAAMEGRGDPARRRRGDRR